ncbi:MULTISPECIES: hypothetical protein [unclassified Pseudomonas]|uniref:hypothetical protein n=1 Tax=unclassified Pseudomonas TaxID=196821 RepID=UPI002600A114|nr:MULTISPECIES: hypothetical protein [unclassified Pseudomonas]
MDRNEIQQHVIDELGKILVDKSVIQEQDDVMVRELFLDSDDFAVFFADLQSDFDIALPNRIKTDLSHMPDNPDYSQLTLGGLVDLILVQMKTRKHH